MSSFPLLALFCLPCSIDRDPPTGERIHANRLARLCFFALHAMLCALLAVLALRLLRDGIDGLPRAVLLGSSALTALSLGLNWICLRQAGAPMPAHLLAPLAAWCDEHPALDAYRRKVVAQGRFFCAEEFSMLREAALELSAEPAFARLYLVSADASSDS